MPWWYGGLSEHILQKCWRYFTWLILIWTCTWGIFFIFVARDISAQSLQYFLGIMKKKDFLDICLNRIPLLKIIKGFVSPYCVLGKIYDWSFSKQNWFFPTNETFHQFHDLDTNFDLHRITSGFHGALAKGVACQQGTLTLPDTWFRPPFWDLLMLQLLRPNSSNLPCLYSTFHLEYPLVLSRFSFLKVVLIYKNYTFSLENPNFPAFLMRNCLSKRTIGSIVFLSCKLLNCALRCCIITPLLNTYHINYLRLLMDFCGTASIELYFSFQNCFLCRAEYIFKGSAKYERSKYFEKRFLNYAFRVVFLPMVLGSLIWKVWINIIFLVFEILEIPRL